MILIKTRLSKLSKSELATTFVGLMQEDPHGWEQRRCTLNYRDGTMLWTANTPFWDLDSYYYGGALPDKFGFIGKIKVWWAYKKWQKVSKLAAKKEMMADTSVYAAGPYDLWVQHQKEKILLLKNPYLTQKRKEYDDILKQYEVLDILGNE